MVTVQLRHRSWLRRVLNVCAPQAVYVVEYSGWGFDYETVYVNGRVADRRPSPLWFASRFKFRLGEYAAVLDVRVWPWFIMREFCLRIEGGLVYEEQ